MSDDPMRERLILPILIPVGALATVLFVALVMSQILLNVTPEVATAIALMFAFNMLTAFSIRAARPDGGRFQLGVLTSIAVLPLVLGAAAATGLVPLPDGDHGTAEEVPSVHIASDMLVFDKSELEVPADVEFDLVFDNKEAQPHNVAILAEQGSTTVLFRGAIITGPEVLTERVDPIPAGTYYFQCDVHPNMFGTVIADAGGGEDADAEEH